MAPEDTHGTMGTVIRMREPQTEVEEGPQTAAAADTAVSSERMD